MEQNLAAVFTVSLLPNFLETTQIYAALTLAEQIIFHHFQLEYGVYNYLVVFLSYFIIETKQGYYKYLVYLYVPLFMYAFEADSPFYIYPFFAMCAVYFVRHFWQQHQVRELRVIIIALGLLILRKWYPPPLSRYHVLFLFAFLCDKDYNTYQLLFARCFVARQLIDWYVQLSALIPRQLFNYKQTLKAPSCIEVTVVLLAWFFAEFKRNRSSYHSSIL